jgi:drug/metabolite transporter (DMT)-like permease
MSAVLYAIIGIFLYATQNIILDLKLRQYSTAATVLVFYLATAPIAVAALLRMRAAGEPIIWPTGPGLWFALAAGVVFFFADYFYVAAYTTAGANVFAVTVCAALMPVFVAVLSLLLTGTLPNLYQFLGILMAVGAVVLVAKGS